MVDEINGKERVNGVIGAKRKQHWKEKDDQIEEVSDSNVIGLEVKEDSSISEEEEEEEIEEVEEELIEEEGEEEKQKEDETTVS